MTRLKDELAALQPDDDERSSWRPEVIDPATPEGWAALRDLLRSGRVRRLHDPMDEQLGELAETRLPRPADAAKRPHLVEALLEGRSPDRFGRWVFYPWSGRLVHLLAEPEFRELRSSRNRYKITAPEQERLRSLKVGVVGLSVGQASAVTLAQEEIGGEFRLADFDVLSLSNMNRLRAGVHSIGVNKAILTAREIVEINPYARIRVFTSGLDESNIGDFLEGGGRLDLLIEECDDLFMKVFLRERARERRIPTLMETSDRGLIDVERFDLEPDRPLLHGLIGDVRAEDLKGLRTADKVPFVLDILGTTTLSTRFAGSLFEIDRTLRTWPQLASGVALGGALNADAARRIALGSFRDSGRFYVDLEQIVADGRGVEVGRSPPLPRIETPEPIPVTLRPSSHLSEGEVRELVRIATLAPSGGNVQPWLFESASGRLLLRYDPQRSGSTLDFERRGTYLALGAAAENLRLATAAAGLAAHLSPFPDPSQPDLVCEITFGGRAPSPSGPTLDALVRRVTNRRLADPRALSREAVETLQAEAERAGGRLQFLLDRAELDELGRVLGGGDRIRFVNAHYGPEMKMELRWTEDEVLGTLDGLDVRSLELSPTDLAAIRLAMSGSGLDMIRELGLGSALEEGAMKSLAGCSAAMLVTVPGEGAERFFDGGRVIQRVWVAAQELGLAVQPYTALLYIFMRAASGDNGTFRLEERATLAELRRRYLGLLPSRAGETEIMLFRVAHAGPPSARSLRRPVEEVLTFRN